MRNYKQLSNTLGRLQFSSVQTDTGHSLLSGFLTEADMQTQALDLLSLILFSGDHSQSGHELYCSSEFITSHFKVPTSSQIYLNVFCP